MKLIRLGSAALVAAALMAPAISPASPQSDYSTASSSDSSAKTARAEKMKDCMAQQKAANSSMSKSEMRAACKNEMKEMKKESSSPPGETAPERQAPREPESPQ